MTNYKNTTINHDLINEVKEKEKEGSKALLNFLSHQDINTLHQLSLVFKGGSTRYPGFRIMTLVQFPVFFATGLIIVFSMVTSNSTFEFVQYIKFAFAVFLAVHGSIMMFKIHGYKKESALIKSSKDLLSKEKIIYMIDFTLNEKYKNLS
ncbi:hypothetical protein JOD43_001055 [Pullulanibacillus pueri]|uniref:Uncharacterized protein n=1 Tax=Pullulanibacillus pueri TaxID=1437324 RepID=A0A8J3EMM2_9BACL|nr:hypothetical protein [Pullulanibacillus pueri]MBM7680889.1 hypothetical protein [Pullulanibacillus pueri]GGH81222.1 hypothetical protein GCM10007096_18800 [Pullulanibacillus pueri]